MPGFVDIDLASLASPEAVQVPDYAALVAQRKAAVLDKITDPALRAEVAAVLVLESEPLVKDIEVSAYRETLVYQRINDAVRAVLLATSTGADLRQLCARLGVAALDDPGDPEADPPRAPALESDESLRQRYQLALEAFSTAGPYGAYQFHARSAHPHVKGVGVYGPESELVDPGQVMVVVLSSVGTGAPTEQVLAAVTAKLSHEDVRPLTDEVIVQGAEIVTYEIVYHLEIVRGPDPALIVEAARAELQKYATSRHRVGAVVRDSGLDGAAHRPGVERAVRTEPEEEIDPGLEAAAYCTDITVTYEVVDA